MQFSKFVSNVTFAAAPILFVVATHGNALVSFAAASNPSAYKVGLAKVDITPEGPIRLSGFYHRQTESIGVREPIYARAMAIQNADGKPAVLITVDSIGIPAAMRNEIAKRLASKKKLPNENLQSAPHIAIPRRCYLAYSPRCSVRPFRLISSSGSTNTRTS